MRRPPSAKVGHNRRTVGSARRAAILVEDAYQVVELWYPYYRLMEAGFEVTLVGPGRRKSYHSKTGYPATEDRSARDVSVGDLDAVVIPGGFSPDMLRQCASIKRLVAAANRQRKVIAAICHGPSVLLSAGILRDRTLTCYRAIIDDVLAAGARVVNRPLVVDGNLVTARIPADLPAWGRGMIEAIVGRPLVRKPLKRRVAILVEDDYQVVEFWYPYYRLQEEGCEVVAVGTGRKREYGDKDGGYPVIEDMTARQAKAKNFDAVVIPGGYSPDALRQDREVKRFVAEMDRAGKVVAAICHGPSVLLSAGIVRGRKMTSFRSIRDDLVAAGAKFQDAAVVTDDNIITSRTPPDMPVWIPAVIKAIRKEKD